MEKIKTKEGLREYIKAKNVNFNLDPPNKHPELNMLFLNTDFLSKNKMSFSSQYYDNKVDEDKIRSTFGIKTALKLESKIDLYSEEMSDLTNQHLVKEFKDETQLLVQTLKSPHFQEHATSYAKTADNMRIDIGLIISRPPIFLGVHKEDMEFGKYRRSVFKKYYNDNSKHINDLETFNDLTSEYWDVSSGNFRINKDNIANIRKLDENTNEYKFYSGNSKHYSLVDPECDDTKSIQYASKLNLI